MESTSTEKSSGLLNNRKLIKEKGERLITGCTPGRHGDMATMYRPCVSNFFASANSKTHYCSIICTKKNEKGAYGKGPNSFFAVHFSLAERHFAQMVENNVHCASLSNCAIAAMIRQMHRHRIVC